MVLQIIADRKVDMRSDADRFQIGGFSNSRKHQDLW
jgi:hypothetical protein